MEREASDDGRQSSRFEMEPEEMRATDLVIKASTRGINSSANVDVTLSALNITGYHLQDIFPTTRLPCR